MKFSLKLTRSENVFFESKIRILGHEQYFFQLWRKWGLRLINQNKFSKEIHLYLLIRAKNENQLMYKTFSLNDFYYELFRAIAVYLDLELSELISYLIYKDMIGDEEMNESKFFISHIA